MSDSESEEGQGFLNPLGLLIGKKYDINRYGYIINSEYIGYINGEYRFNIDGIYAAVEEKDILLNNSTNGLTFNSLGNGEECFNEHSLGTCHIPSEGNPNTKNFNTTPFNESDGSCRKYTWSNNCGVSWDGITYGVTNPCIKPETETK